MGKPNLAQICKSARKAIAKRSPEILTGLGIAGMITTTVLAVRATPKALQSIEEEKRKQNRALLDEATDCGYDVCQQIDKLKPIEMVKVAWKPYIPAIVTGTVSTACLIGASSVNAKRNAALAAAYNLSTTALAEYKEKVIETVGEKREKTIRDKVSEERVKKNPVVEEEVYDTRRGSTLCFDPLSARYFRCDIDVIKRAELTIKERLLHDICGSASVNEFYDEIGLPHTSVGDNIGWNTDELIKIRFSSHLTDKGVPSAVIDYEVEPKYGYDRY
ncbi:MAG: hypothetical protein IIX75_03925 [Clostridia bacterium]|nr:hypothetical protein [Clostridia bacterium]